METTVLSPNSISKTTQRASMNLKLPPPKMYKKYEKILTAWREKNKDKKLVDPEDIPEEVWEYISTIYDPENHPKDLMSWPMSDQHEWMMKYVGSYMIGLPESLRSLLLALIHPGDNARPISELPEWLDMEKFRRGQKFALNNFLGISVSMLLSFCAGFTFKNGLQPLIITKKSITPYGAFFRYLKNVEAAYAWYEDLPWKEGSKSYKMLQAVRRAHQSQVKLIRAKGPHEVDELTKIRHPWSPMRETFVKEFRTTCPKRNALQCPYSLYADRPDRVKNFNQADMFVGLFGFTGLALISPEICSIPNAKDEDLEAFCHVWRTLGYLLGIDDEFNFCNGSLEDIRKRTRDFVEYWVKPNMTELEPEWEHVFRCAVEGLKYVLPIPTYETVVVLVAESLNIATPGLYASLDWTSWFTYKLYKLWVNYLIRIPGAYFVANKLTIHWMFAATKYSQAKLKKLKTKSDKILQKYSVLF